MSTFKITPEDVGRKVRLRNGKILPIERYVEEDIWSYKCGGGYAWSACGKASLSFRDHPDDIVGWVDNKFSDSQIQRPAHHVAKRYTQSFYCLEWYRYGHFCAEGQCERCAKAEGK